MATAKPSSATSASTAQSEFDAERERDRDHRLRERDADQQRAVLEAVDDRSCQPGTQDDRAPEREEHGGDRERRAGALLDVQDQGDQRQEVTQRGESGGTGQQAKVAGDRHGGDRRGRAFAQRSACVNAAR